MVHCQTSNLLMVSFSSILARGINVYEVFEANLDRVVGIQNNCSSIFNKGTGNAISVLIVINKISLIVALMYPNLFGLCGTETEQY